MRRPALRPTLFAALLLGLLVVLVQLGQWQLERRVWKQALIAQVAANASAAPVAPLPPAEWATLDDGLAYRRVQLTGQFDHARETCVQAVTVHGPGFWVLTPLQQANGRWVLVNRGFFPPQDCDPARRASGQTPGEVTVVGLLRLSEPKGGFLRDNDPQGDRWYARDVAAIGAARGLPVEQLAPYFVDAEHGVEGGPIGGLTVLQFRDHHLIYALTWFGLAGLAALGLALLLRPALRRRAPTHGIR